jgi:hypothetical protein
LVLVCFFLSLPKKLPACKAGTIFPANECEAGHTGPPTTLRIIPHVNTCRVSGNNFCQNDGEVVRFWG